MTGRKVIVTLTPLRVEADSRTFKQAASLARLGYRSIVVEGVRSGIDRSSLPFELISCAPARESVAARDSDSDPSNSSAAVSDSTPWSPNRNGKSLRRRARRLIERLPAGQSLVAPLWRLDRFARRASGAASENLVEFSSHPHVVARSIPAYLIRLISLLISPAEILVSSPVQFFKHLCVYFRLYLVYPLRVTPRASLYYLHSFYQFPAVFLMCLRYRVRFIYDAHDFYSHLENDESLSRYWRRWVMPWQNFVERLCVRSAASVVTVNDGVAQLMKGRFGCDPVVIRNAHDARLDHAVDRTIRESIRLSSEEFLLVSVGNWKPGMAISEALTALKDLPDRYHLAFLGTGYPIYDDQLASNGLCGRVHFLAPVAPTRVVPFIRSADAAIILYYPKSPNYLNSLPNRFFQPVAANIPLLYPSLPEIRRLAARYNVGVLIEPRDPDSIRSALLELGENPIRQAEIRQCLTLASAALSYEQEEKKLRILIDRFFDPATQDGAIRPAADGFGGEAADSGSERWQRNA